jgi:hypothetical protein
MALMSGPGFKKRDEMMGYLLHKQTTLESLKVTNYELKYNNRWS